MFHSLAKRFRSSSAPSNRLVKQRTAFCSRRLGLESLESREMLSATPLDFSPPALHLDGLDPPPGLARQIHWIHGEAIKFDSYPAPPAAADALDAGTASTVASGSLHPLDSLPQLHSNPSATAQLYLDFNGHVQPDWGGTTPAYDRDGDASSFSDAELDSMYVIWSRVAEDFVPFNINVTTVEPPVLAEGVPESVANGIAVRIAIGGDGSWTGGNFGGYAPIGAFTNSAPNVAYVFSENFSQFWTYWIGDVASHEAGHTFGLGHQSSYDQNGNLIDTYNPGFGSWGPLMGNTYKEVTTWYNGTSGGPSSFQDDMAIIAGGVNGFGYRTDDHGNALNSATPLATDGISWNGSGNIETNSDVDTFSFTVAAESVYRMAVDVAQIGPNLDAVLELRNAVGELLAMAAPYDMQATEVVQSLLPGSYFLSVRKSAIYGWVGQYTVAIDEPEAAIFVTPASYPLITSEGGAAASFSVVLSTAPTADVQIPISSSSAAEGVASVTSLDFTQADWEVPQTVTINGLDDNVPDGDVGYAIVLGAAVSADLRFNGLNPPDVSVTNLDNDVKFFVVDDAATNISYRYASDGTPRGTSALIAPNSAPRGVASTIAGDKTWVVDANRTVYVYSASGALLGSWTAGTLAKTATPEGIATDGTDVWIVDSKSDKVYRYAEAASRLSGSQNAVSSFSLNRSNANPKDIVTNGQSLWVVDDAAADNVFKYAVAGGSQGSWTISTSGASSPTGITINPAKVGDIWIVDSGTDLVYKYNSATFRTSGNQGAAATFALAAGNTNPQGIADPPAAATAVVADPTATESSIHRINTLPILGESRGAGNRRQAPSLISREASVENATRSDLSPAMKYQALLAREQFFSSFAPQPNDVSTKRALRAATASKDDSGKLIDSVAHITGPLNEARDTAFASVL